MSFIILSSSRYPTPYKKLAAKIKIEQDGRVEDEAVE